MSDRPKDRQDGNKAGMPSYEREAQALREKTERLRALRLARDGAETVAPAASGAGGPAKARGGKAPARGKSAKASGSLSDWLKTQQDQGRRS
ncbi:MAG: hypothetical protein HXX10_12745 [Rhodoplanes sp.]|uniref:hypothetical protein n=1 Tax=Rhodoplanes sp. TaxID=1968906 RepID=UPI001795CFB7|nr:hypothetical protein [Rhodoplanes sp.]NVO14896.1 hypothetical protein [Rhodoplanes sp.]